MKLMTLLLGTFAAVVAVPTLASAQTRAETREPTKPVPPIRSYNTPPPTPPGLVTGPIEPVITKEAGIGGTQAYARRGVLELGGSGGLSRSSSFTSVNIAPSVGWFILNNVELTGIVGLNYIHSDTSNSTVMTVLAEPSYHQPFTDYLYGFLGVGAGISYAYTGEGKAGIALAPRVGLNVIVGRSGILTPAFVLNYSTAPTVAMAGTPGDRTSLGVNVGYTVMW